MTAQTFSYKNLFFKMRGHLLRECPVSTVEITQCIKSFFLTTYQASYNVLCSHSEGCEFITDVLVTTFNPKNIITKKTLQLTCNRLNVFLAAESELGGVGASSAYGVMKNVVEDYLKLLVTLCEYRVMVFTSLPYSNEENHIVNRVETLRKLYSMHSSLSGGVLLIHLSGDQPRSTQVQARATAEAISGFVISSDGNSVSQLSIPEGESPTE